MAKRCKMCGKPIGAFTKHVALSDGVICKKCFENLGFDYKDKDLYSHDRFDQIVCGYGAYMRNLIGDVPDQAEYIELFVAGFDFRQKELKSLLTEENDDYSLPKKAFLEEVAERTYQYYTETYPATLVPEPDNEYDPNAIAVYVDDLHIGYIQKKDQNQVDLDQIESVEAEIYGGKYKDIDFSDYEEELVKGETPYKAKLIITKKEES